MHHKRHLILISLLTCGALVWPVDRATAQVRSIFGPRVPDTADNTITADIMPLTSVAPGDISLNIDGAGLVYIY
jgi:hypothetical protein